MARENNGNPLTDNQLARLIKGSASQVWHAGRGAYSRAGHEGSRLFGSLVDLGGRLDRGAKSRVVGVRSSATDAWERLEDAFVQRVARALNALQIPTARDIHELNARVAALQAAVVALERRAARMAARPARAPAARKPAARKTRQPGTPAKRGSARSRQRSGT